MSTLRHFDVPQLTYRTIGPCREQTCYACHHRSTDGDYCDLFREALAPRYYRTDTCKLAEAEAKDRDPEILAEARRVLFGDTAVAAIEGL